MTMEDNTWTKEMIDDHFREMALLLTENCESQLKTDWFEKYRYLQTETVEHFSIMEDDVQRLKKSILLHDALAQIPSKDLLDLIIKYDIPYEC